MPFSHEGVWDFEAVLFHEGSVDHHFLRIAISTNNSSFKKDNPTASF